MDAEAIVKFAEQRHATEMWTMKNNRLVEWHAHCTEHPSEVK